MVEPPGTHSKLPCRPASPCSTVVRGGWVWSNHPKLTRYCPVGLLPPAAQWFEVVWCGRTTPNSLATACFPQQHSGSRRFGVVEPPRTHSLLPCRPASPSSTVGRGGSVWSNHLELTRNFPVDLLPLATKWFEEVRRTFSNHREQQGV